MKNLLNKFGRIAVIAAIALLSTAAISTAHADDHRRGPDREWAEHARGARDWHRHHRDYVPGVVYAPPAVIEAPPPQPMGINLVIPFDFR